MDVNLPVASINLYKGSMPIGPLLALLWILNDLIFIALQIVSVSSLYQ